MRAIKVINNLERLCDSDDFIYRLGLPVPYGFIITAETCMEYYGRKQLPEHLMQECGKVIHDMERKSGHIFGNTDPRLFPLLFSIRCGTSVAVP